MKIKILLLLFIITYLSCSRQNELTKHEGQKQGFGFIQLKDSCFVLETDSEIFYPVNLAENLKIEGLKVKFSLVTIFQELRSSECIDLKRVHLKEIIPYRK